MMRMDQTLIVNGTDKEIIAQHMVMNVLVLTINQQNKHAARAAVVILTL